VAYGRDDDLPALIEDFVEEFVGIRRAITCALRLAALAIAEYVDCKSQ
jgi:hypothetical protein